MYLVQLIEFQFLLSYNKIFIIDEGLKVFDVIIIDLIRISRHSFCFEKVIFLFYLLIYPKPVDDATKNEGQLQLDKKEKDFKRNWKPQKYYNF